MAVKPVFIGENRSRIITTHGSYLSKLSPRNLLDKACIIHMSSMDGRITAAKFYLKNSNKTPFIIIPNKYGVFPTKSPANPECVWIFNHRFTVEEVTKGESVITFVNGTIVKVKASKHTILKQNHRLDTLLNTGDMMDRERKYLSTDMFIKEESEDY